jgi:heme-degrading monooxygenase HmoA
MITHSVIFKLKYAKNSKEEQAFMKAAMQLRSIPGVQSFEVLKQTSKKNKFEYGISMKFENQKLYDGYSNHPDHVKFVKEWWMKDVEDFLEIDYEPLD